MTGILNEPRIPYKGTISYLFGAFFLFMSLCSFCSHSSRSYLAGLFFLLAAILTIPPTLNQLEKKINAVVNGIAQFFIIFFLVAMAFAVTPATPATTNSTSYNTEMVSVLPSSVNVSEVTTAPPNLTQVTTQERSRITTKVSTNRDPIDWGFWQVIIGIIGTVLTLGSLIVAIYSVRRPQKPSKPQDDTQPQNNSINER